MLRLPEFRFLQPRTLGDLTAMLAGEPDVRVVAGGTDLWPNMKRRHQKAQTVVSLMRLPELSGIHANGDLRLGATTILSDIEADPRVRERWPALATAVASISSHPLRNMSTIGGNVCVDTRCTYYNQTEDWRRSIDYCMKAEGQICWVATNSPTCLAHSASDSAPMLCALSASVRLLSKDGERLIPLETLYNDDGIHYLTKRPDEIVTDIYVPGASDAARCRSAFWKLRRRGSIDFAVLSAAVALWTDPAAYSLPPLGGRFAGSWAAMLAVLAAWPAARGLRDEARLPALALVALPAGAIVAALRTEADPGYLAALALLIGSGAAGLRATADARLLIRRNPKRLERQAARRIGSGLRI
jgi:4-hydroxybenzoyl-CoA reductase subunit beta